VAIAYHHDVSLAIASTYRNIALVHADRSITFQIGTEEYVADDLAGARAIVDEVLEDCFVHRGVMVAPRLRKRSQVRASGRRL